MVSMDLELIIQSFPLFLRGLQETMLIAVTSIIIGIAGGIPFGIIRCSKNKIIQLISRIYVEIFRVFPILVLLFIFFFGLPVFLNIDTSGRTTSIIVFSLWAISEVGEVVRGALQSIHKSQRESGEALGLNKTNLYLYVIIPQAVKRMIPPTINICIRIIKTTSLTILIGVTEVIKVGQQIIERTGEALTIYTALFIMYFLICYPLSKWSRRLEERWAV
ncbi:amino acid ABC transporter permease [Metabacillus fastidiosus]|uniref:amino acid ABC transporter permease n=1 Tax=Metabacillus fastidiosus TaxID=1458 RepID=UPI003D27AC2E